jgi:hypothetical protein
MQFTHMLSIKSYSSLHPTYELSMEMKLHSNQIHKKMNVMILLTTMTEMLQEGGWVLVSCVCGK